MRTLAFLAASLLLVLLAQAEPLQGRADQAEPEMQGVEEDQAAVISWEERPALQDGGVWRSDECTCRRPACESGENPSGFCNINNVYFQLCCT
ncbi:neutrophil defensin 4-like [Octodon degus]|uniref:Neutrophil defensin 4-like n=1 Tax=Octodon degus TaxID=10160 RepID=A0A6P6DE79_OCTDE|nr:neutrophil defensin 4-like [Octodon degus]